MLYPLIATASFATEHLRERIKPTLESLPQHNRDLLQEFLRILWIIDQNSNRNGMDAYKLAEVIAPPLFSKGQATPSKKKGDQEPMNIESKLILLFKAMITDYEELFKVKPFRPDQII